MKTVEIPKGFDTTVDPNQIDEVKKLFFEEYETNPDQYDERDIDHLRNSDLHATRFLVASQHDVQEAFEALKTAFKWRKSFGLHDLNEESFPTEFFDLAGLFECGQDRFGFPCIYARVKTVRKIKEFDHHQTRFLAYMINKIERRFESLQCWTLVFDCSDIGFCNVNFTLIHFLIDLLRYYMPLSVRYAIVLNVPWILNAIQKLVLSLLPDDNKQLIRFVNSKNFNNYVNEDQIPLMLGGSNLHDVFAHSPNCVSFAEKAKEIYDIEIAEAQKLLKPYRQLFEEAKNFKDQLREKIRQFEFYEISTNNNFEIIKADDCLEVHD